MKKLLLNPPHENIEGRYRKHKNNIINLYNCKAIKKSTVAWYPDNIGVFSIKFKGCGEEWVFESKKDRDECINNLLNNVEY